MHTNLVKSKHQSSGKSGLNHAVLVVIRNLDVGLRRSTALVLLCAGCECHSAWSGVCHEGLLCRNAMLVQMI